MNNYNVEVLFKSGHKTKITITKEDLINLIRSKNTSIRNNVNCCIDSFDDSNMFFIDVTDIDSIQGEIKE